jgi:hypothetical protein
LTTNPVSHEKNGCSQVLWWCPRQLGNTGQENFITTNKDVL